MVFLSLMELANNRLSFFSIKYTFLFWKITGKVRETCVPLKSEAEEPADGDEGSQLKIPERRETQIGEQKGTCKVYRYYLIHFKTDQKKCIKKIFCTEPPFRCYCPISELKLSVNSVGFQELCTSLNLKRQDRVSYNCICWDLSMENEGKIAHTNSSQTYFIFFQQNLLKKNPSK